MSVHFSIIVCTHNPNEKIFGRLLQAISLFEYDVRGFEIIIVDNNSNPAIEELLCVREFLDFSANTKIIKEKKPGLTSARITGINNAKCEWVIFFDDDNEPAPSYLKAAAGIITEHPEVGAWGPGKIDVEYIGVKPTPWLDEQKQLFQQRCEQRILFDNKTQWQLCYPFGTGMVIRKEMVVNYRDAVNSLQFTLTDRTGKSLASGGDVQIVLTTIKKGYYAGVAPQLQLNHLISHDKATLQYLEKQNYGTASCSVVAYQQVFPELVFDNVLLNNTAIIRKIYSVFRNHFPGKGWRGFRLQLSKTMGEINARYMNTRTPAPWALRFYQRMIHA